MDHHGPMGVADTAVISAQTVVSMLGAATAVEVGETSRGLRSSGGLHHQVQLPNQPFDPATPSGTAQIDAIAPG